MRTSVDLNRLGGVMGHYACGLGTDIAPVARPRQPTFNQYFSSPFNLLRFLVCQFTWRMWPMISRHPRSAVEMFLRSGGCS